MQKAKRNDPLRFFLYPSHALRQSEPGLKFFLQSLPCIEHGDFSDFLCSGLFIPHSGLILVYRRTFTVVVHLAALKLILAVALLGGLREQSQRFGILFRFVSTYAVLVQFPRRLCVLSKSKQSYGMCLLVSFK